MKRAFIALGIMILIFFLAILLMTGCSHQVAYETYYEPVRVYKVKRVVYYEHHEPVTYVKEKPIYIHGHSHHTKKIAVVKKKVNVKKGKQQVFNHHAPHTKKKKVHKKKVVKHKGNKHYHAR